MSASSRLAHRPLPAYLTWSTYVLSRVSDLIVPSLWRFTKSDSANHSLLKSVDQPLLLCVIADDLLPRITPSHHMMNDALIIKPKSTRHVRGG
jgi:hypothetical protein